MVRGEISDRVIHDKGRLDQFFLTVLLEEEVDDITLSYGDPHTRYDAHQQAS